jgi:DNA-binding SARP family transcriptional activator
MATGIRFVLLGPVRGWRGETALELGHPQQRAVLAGLLLGEGASMTLEELADLVWGDDPPATALSTIRTYVDSLRQVLGDDLIRSSGGRYRLVLDAESVDVVRFKRLVTQAAATRRTPDPALAETLLAEALALWTGTALAGVPGPAAAAERMLLGELRLAAVEEHLVCGLDLGRHAETAAELTYLVATHPLRERLRELLMIALYGAGRQADALAVFDDTRRVLRNELGIDPAPRLHDVHRRILRADPELRATSRAPELCWEPVPPSARPAGVRRCSAGRR